ncbi:GvpL/GvpF family gas vesicle protein [Mycolicibacterium goodii]|uniref:GvpL/GvpF family gas vesicle protein n=1 Tax=Mycolicibacterium goodii TaxID=134601 RepID=A0ABS6HLI6_MYCGD|nr:GvpL/GvpF family gas vesicle protein [Mycolicibacterium goodii]MBU8819362.1 GvpL/GvpF family gas vesicle protein [Mycolicibacterium goodii]MBU8823557.1 GvpL/GvpF family gas vesicle protein [Mycolicibacterium goodii]MBU8835728.1 GvpL/GvpF family gas vesicle protein [Mycolicibacterium goodii]OKH68029.1 gas vesicle synthesis GvpLGvpF [Mycobacterium sp. SWH-M5]
MSATYVYGLIRSDAELPRHLRGLGPSGRVTTISHRRVAAIVSDLPADRPLGTRDDLIAHERVLDTVAQQCAVLPMRFPAVVEESGVVDELLAPHEERFLEVLTRLDGMVQFTLKARYEQDVVLREIAEGDDEIMALRERVRELPEDASYYDRIRLGELVVGEMERRRSDEGNQVLERLRPCAAAVAVRPQTQPDEVVNAAFLVARDRIQPFDDAVEQVGRDFAGRMRFRLLGPLAPYDFIPEG